MSAYRDALADLLEWAESVSAGWVPGPAAITRARALLAEAQPVEPGQLSDGYHTFDELYEHRHALCLALMRALPWHCWFSRRHADGEMCFGKGEWFIVGVDLHIGHSITYHLPIRLWEAAQATGAGEVERAPHWDGHTAADVVERLKSYAAGGLAEAQPVSTPEPVEPTDETEQWYSYCPEEGIEVHQHKELAQKAAQQVMGCYADSAHSDGWHEDMDLVSWGMLLPVEQAQVVERGKADPASGFDEWVKYELRPATATRTDLRPAPEPVSVAGDAAWREFIEAVQHAQHVAMREGESPRFDLVATAFALWRSAAPEPVSVAGDPTHPAQLAADIRTAVDSTWVHQPVVAALLELASQMERQPISPATVRAVANELSRYP